MRSNCKMQEIRRKECSDPKCIWERIKWGKTAKENSNKKILVFVSWRHNKPTKENTQKN